MYWFINVHLHVYTHAHARVYVQDILLPIDVAVYLHSAWAGNTTTWNNNQTPTRKWFRRNMGMDGMSTQCIWLVIPWLARPMLTSRSFVSRQGWLWTGGKVLKCLYFQANQWRTRFFAENLYLGQRSEPYWEHCLKNCLWLPNSNHRLSPAIFRTPHWIGSPFQPWLLLSPCDERRYFLLDWQHVITRAFSNLFDNLWTSWFFLSQMLMVYIPYCYYPFVCIPYHLLTAYIHPYHLFISPVPVVSQMIHHSGANFDGSKSAPVNHYEASITISTIKEPSLILSYYIRVYSLKFPIIYKWW